MYKILSNYSLLNLLSPILIMPLPSEQHQNTTSEYTPCKTDTHRGMIKHMLGCLGKALPDRSLSNMSDYIIQHFTVLFQSIRPGV